jgi:hypothetical protein
MPLCSEDFALELGGRRVGVIEFSIQGGWR